LGVAVALAVGVAVAVGLGVGVAVAVGLGVGVAVAVVLGVEIAVAVALAVGVGFAVKTETTTKSTTTPAVINTHVFKYHGLFVLGGDGGNQGGGGGGSGGGGGGGGAKSMTTLLVRVRGLRRHKTAKTVIAASVALLVGTFRDADDTFWSPKLVPTPASARAGELASESRLSTS
jgi:hypothetical protein